MLSQLALLFFLLFLTIFASHLLLGFTFGFVRSRLAFTIVFSRFRFASTTVFDQSRFSFRIIFGTIIFSLTIFSCRLRVSFHNYHFSVGFIFTIPFSHSRFAFTIIFSHSHFVYLFDCLRGRHPVVICKCVGLLSFGFVLLPISIFRLFCARLG